MIESAKMVIKQYLEKAGIFALSDPIHNTEWTSRICAHQLDFFDKEHLRIYLDCVRDQYRALYAEVEASDSRLGEFSAFVDCFAKELEIIASISKLFPSR